MAHTENHTQVLLKNNIVVEILYFAVHNQTLMEETFQKFDYDTVIDFCSWAPITPSLGDYFTGINFVPQPFPSWTLDNTFTWQPPKPKPDGDYQWNEPTQQWKLIIKTEDET